MSSFAIKFPFFVIMLCLMVAVVGVVTVARMPVDLFPNINIPVVVVATFYSGMPPEDIETDITNPLERFFTLASGIDHMESRSLSGVSMIKVWKLRPLRGRSCTKARSTTVLTVADAVSIGRRPASTVMFSVTSPTVISKLISRASWT